MIFFTQINKKWIERLSLNLDVFENCFREQYLNEQTNLKSSYFL